MPASLKRSRFEMTLSESNNTYANATRDCDARVFFWFRFFTFSTAKGAGGTTV